MWVSLCIWQRVLERGWSRVGLNNNPPLGRSRERCARRLGGERLRGTWASTPKKNTAHDLIAVTAAAWRGDWLSLGTCVCLQHGGAGEIENASWCRRRDRRRRDWYVGGPAHVTHPLAACSSRAGIGAAVARGFARSGCSRLAITDINPTTLAQTKHDILRINPSADVFERAVDIADEGFVDAFHDGVFARFQRLDYGVNCAGVLGGDVVKAVDMTTDHFDRLNAINYKGVWLSCRAQLRSMLKQEPLEEHPKQRGAIVSIASQLGIVARPGAGRLIECPSPCGNR